MSGYINLHTREAAPAMRYLDELVRYRHLAINLVGSDLRARFRRSYLGILWAVLQPLGYSLVIAWAWGALFHKESYWEFALYVYSGMLVWEYFTNSVNNSLDCILNASGYLRQARIPFLVFQLRVPLTGAVIFLAGLAGLIVLQVVLAATGQVPMPTPGFHLVGTVLFLPLILVFVTPIAIIFSVLGAHFHDLKHIMHLVLQALFFLSPVMMERSYMENGHLSILTYVNPVVPLLDLFRDPILHGRFWEGLDFLIVMTWCAGFWLLAGLAAMRAGRRLVFTI